MPTEIQKLVANPSWFTAPRIWLRDTVFIIGGGPSLEGFDWSPLHDRPCIGCNDAYVEPLSTPRPDRTHVIRTWLDVCVFGDEGWWSRHWVDRVVSRKNKRDHQGLLHYPGLIVTNCVKGDIKAVSRLKVMQRCNRGVKHPPHQLSWYQNTGAAAICLALLFGASRIVLLGFDMRRINGKNNWHRAIKQEPGKRIFADHITGHTRLKQDLDGANYDVEVLNATPDTALDVWPKVKLEDVL